MNFTPDIQAFCCHYTSQQSCAENGGGLIEDGFPANVTINRLPCSGKLEVTTLLNAFENGADGVYVVGCPKDKCHNVMGSRRAAKKVLAAREALSELGVEEERVAMFHTERGLHIEFIRAAQEMNERITELGAAPFKGEEK